MKRFVFIILVLWNAEKSQDNYIIGRKNGKDNENQKILLGKLYKIGMKKSYKSSKK